MAKLTRLSYGTAFVLAVLFLVSFSVHIIRKPVDCQYEENREAIEQHCWTKKGAVAGYRNSSEIYNGTISNHPDDILVHSNKDVPEDYHLYIVLVDPKYSEKYPMWILSMLVATLAFSITWSIIWKRLNPPFLVDVYNGNASEQISSKFSDWFINQQSRITKIFYGYTFSLLFFCLVLISQYLCILHVVPAISTKLVLSNFELLSNQESYSLRVGESFPRHFRCYITDIDNKAIEKETVCFLNHSQVDHFAVSIFYCLIHVSFLLSSYESLTLLVNFFYPKRAALNFARRLGELPNSDVTVFLQNCKYHAIFLLQTIADSLTEQQLRDIIQETKIVVENKVLELQNLQ